MNYMEGTRSWWGGRASNPVGGAMRRWVGSTPASFRHHMASCYCAAASWACGAHLASCHIVSLARRPEGDIGAVLGGAS